jgi:hypothetical protein
MTVNVEFRDRNRQFEPARTGAARVDIEHAVSRLGQWLVRMPRHDDLESGCAGIEVQLRQIVKDVYEDVVHLENL